MDTKAQGNGNLPAFMMDEMDGSEYRGLTKREMFAAMAMQGFAADPNCTSPTNNAVAAVLWADALLAELAKEPTPCTP